MSYELRKPITEKQRADFIVQYNHTQGLRIEDTEMYLFALEDNEMMGTKEIEMTVLDYDDQGHAISDHTAMVEIPYPVINPNYEEEQAQKERERIARLSLTKREVFLALYRDKGITPEQLKAQIQDPEALIEFEYATEYFRFNPLINLIGGRLGYTSAELDYLFINKKLPNQVEEETIEPEPTTESEPTVELEPTVEEETEEPEETEESEEE